jgi:hypothetical protein
MDIFAIIVVVVAGVFLIKKLSSDSGKPSSAISHIPEDNTSEIKGN